jgi:hypothetical protein
LAQRPLSPHFSTLKTRQLRNIGPLARPLPFFEASARGATVRRATTTKLETSNRRK